MQAVVRIGSVNYYTTYVCATLTRDVERKWEKQVALSNVRTEIKSYSCSYQQAKET